MLIINVNFAISTVLAFAFQLQKDVQMFWNDMSCSYSFIVILLCNKLVLL